MRNINHCLNIGTFTIASPVPPSECNANAIGINFPRPVCGISRWPAVGYSFYESLSYSGEFTM